MLKIQVRLHSNYGSVVIYPVCDRAKTFAKMIRCKTLPIPVIKCIKELGYAVEVVHKPVQLLEELIQTTSTILI